MFRCDQMLYTIAQEAKTMAEFARRAEAYNASLARPLTDWEVANAWLTLGMRALSTDTSTNAIACIASARRKRFAQRDKMFQNAIKYAR